MRHLYGSPLYRPLAHHGRLRARFPLPMHRWVDAERKPHLSHLSTRHESTGRRGGDAGTGALGAGHTHTPHARKAIKRANRSEAVAREASKRRSCGASQATGVESVSIGTQRRPTTTGVVAEQVVEASKSHTCLQAPCRTVQHTSSPSSPPPPREETLISPLVFQSLVDLPHHVLGRGRLPPLHPNEQLLRHARPLRQLANGEEASHPGDLHPLVKGGGGGGRGGVGGRCGGEGGHLGVRAEAPRLSDGDVGGGHYFFVPRHS